MKNKKVLKDSIKLSKFNKKINIFCLIIFIFYIVNNIIMYFNNSYSYFFVSNVINNINGLFYYLSSNISYLSIITLFVYVVIVIINIIVDIYYENFSKENYEKRSKIINYSYTIFVISSLIIILPNYLSQFENHLPNFDELYFQETKNKTYKVEDLVHLDQFLQNKIITISKEIERNEKSEIDIKVDFNKQAVSDLNNISNDISLLKGLYPKNSSKINNVMRGVLGSKVVGFTTPYTTYFDYESTSTSVLSTITHEFCHTKGVVRESETVYCAFLAGIKSDNQLSNYAAYIEAFSWVSEALYSMQPEIADRIEDEVASKCLTDNYLELCELYTMNNEEYIKGAKSIRISSYFLRNYINHLDELEKSLTILSSNKAKMYVNKEEKSINEVINLVKEQSEERVTIECDLSESKFKKIKKAIENKKLYLSVYQQNKKEKTSSYRTKNPQNYYLGPLKDKDENIIFNSSYGSIEHDYSRVARFILEHYEKEDLI